MRWAAPESMVFAAVWTPSARLWTAPPTQRAAAAFASTMSREAVPRPVRHSREFGRRSSSGGADLEFGGIGGVGCKSPISPGRMRYLRCCAALPPPVLPCPIGVEFGDVGVGADGDFAERAGGGIVAGDDEGALGAEADEDFEEFVGEFWRAGQADRPGGGRRRGLVRGPRMLKMVEKPRVWRMVATCFMAGWCLGAKAKQMLAALRQWAS